MVSSLSHGGELCLRLNDGPDLKLSLRFSFEFQLPVSQELFSLFHHSMLKFHCFTVVMHFLAQKGKQRVYKIHAINDAILCRDSASYFI